LPQAYFADKNYWLNNPFRGYPFHSKYDDSNMKKLNTAPARALALRPGLACCYLRK
jgi:hypothetical protein